MQCPDCKGEIGRAIYCGCGWKKTSLRVVGGVQDVRCAHSECGIDAMCRVKTKTGWANLCWQHYDQYFERQAIDNLSKYGMERKADEARDEWVMRMRQFVKGGLKRLSGA